MRIYPGVIFLPFAFPGLPQVGVAFTTRMGGISSKPFDRANLSMDVGDDPAKVLANRKGLKQSLGFSSWQELVQVHGTRMIFDPEPADVYDVPALEADGQATAKVGQALVVKSADCQPLLLAHASGKYVAALHVGWRGNVQGFPTLGTKAFCEKYGLDPSEVLAVRGPSLGPSRSEFQNYDSEFGAEFSQWYDERTRSVDLWRLTRDQLLEAGLKPGNIFSLDLCTASLPDMFFSYRRDRITGRQASIVWIKKG